MRKSLCAVAVLLAVSSAHADIKIGVAGPFSGQYQPYGQAMLLGVRTAVDKINGAGGLRQDQITIIQADDQCDVAKAEDAARKLLSAQVDVVVGHFCSNASAVAAKLYEAANVTMISPSATLAVLTEQNLSNVVRVATRTDAQGAFAAKRVLLKRPNAKLALIDDGTAEMRAITASFVSAYSKTPALTVTTTADQKDFSSVVAKLKEANIDTAYLALSSSDAGRLTAQASAAGLDLKRYGPDSLVNDVFWQTAGNAGENTLASFPVDPQNTSQAKVLAADLKALGQASEGPVLPAYAAVELFASAAQAEGAHAGRKIAERLKNGEAYQTILGPLAFNAKGDGTELRFNWYQWNNGVYQVIAPENP